MSFMRGRINRAVYWLIVCVAIAMYVVIDLVARKPTGVSEVVLVFLCVPRLHDIGRSGWLVLWPILFEVGGAIAAFTLLPLATATAAMGVVVLVIATLLIWLGCIPGQPTANKFGDPPTPGLGRRKPKLS